MNLTKKIIQVLGHHKQIDKTLLMIPHMFESNNYMRNIYHINCTILIQYFQTKIRSLKAKKKRKKKRREKKRKFPSKSQKKRKKQTNVTTWPLNKESHTQRNINLGCKQNIPAGLET